jgi:hypothetical protein
MNRPSWRYPRTTSSTRSTYASTSFYSTVIYGGGISAEMMLRARF